MLLIEAPFTARSYSERRCLLWEGARRAGPRNYRKRLKWRRPYAGPRALMLGRNIRLTSTTAQPFACFPQNGRGCLGAEGPRFGRGSLFATSRKAWAAMARQGLELRDAGFTPRVGKERVAWTRRCLELPDAGISPRVGKAMTSRTKQGLALTEAKNRTSRIENCEFSYNSPQKLWTSAALPHAT